MRARQHIGRALAVAGIVAGTASFVAGPTASATTAIRHGGSVTFSLAGLRATIDPAYDQVSLFTGVSSLEAVYGPGLMYVDPTTGAVQMGQAQSIKSSAGGRVWTMTLHSGMKFSDGTPFNAAAVCADVHRLANPAIGSVFQAYSATIRCTTHGSTTVVWTLPAPNYYFPNVVSQNFPFIPSPTAVASEGSAFSTKPVGAGPFKLASLVSGVSQTFVKNPYYGLFAKGQPYLDEVVMESSGTLSQIVAALQSGQAQIANPINVQYATQERAAGAQAAMHSTAGGAFLALNLGRAPFNSLTARQAVYDVINRQGVANVWTPGNPVTTNLFPTTSPYFNKSLNWPDANTAKAQQLLDRYAAQTGGPLKFSILWPTTTAPTTPSYIQSLFSGLRNVQVDIKMETQTQYASDAQNGNYDLTPEGLYNTTLIPAIQQWFETGGSLNYMRWSDPKADKALQGLYTARTVAAQQTAWNTIVKEMIAQVPVIWTQQGRIGIAYNPNQVAGIHAVEFGNATLWGGVHRV